MPTPPKFLPDVAVYFRDFADGRHDERAHLTYIYPADKSRLSDDGQVLLIGSPGVDGLEFAYRADAPGIWVWYPIDDEWLKVADNIDDLDRSWRSGALTV